MATSMEIETSIYRVEYMSRGGDWGVCEVRAETADEAERKVKLSSLVHEFQRLAHATHRKEPFGWIRV